MLGDFIPSGGPLIFPLLACSVIGFAVVFERFFFWISYKSQFNSERVETTYLHLQHNRTAEALKTIGDSQDPSLVCVKRCLETHQKIKPLTLESMALQVLKPTKKFAKHIS